MTRYTMSNANVRRQDYNRAWHGHFERPDPLPMWRFRAVVRDIQATCTHVWKDGTPATIECPCPCAVHICLGCRGIAGPEVP